jgi:uncharacterized protein YbjT (DUF2867 family)
VDVVTGAFSFTGRYVAARLLDSGREVRTLTSRPTGASPFGDRVPALALDFDDPAGIVAALRGADTLYVTYWIRFPDGSTTFGVAEANSARLFRAAAEAGVRRLVYLSVANASAESPYAYFRAKAAVETLLAGAGLPYAIVRPTLVFGEGEVLVNNVAWLLRRLPLFVLPAGPSRVQPVAAEDVAGLCVEAASGPAGTIVDAAGPDILGFEELVLLVRAAVGSGSRLVHGHPGAALLLAGLLGRLTGRTLVTEEELRALEAGLLTSAEPPRGTRRFGDWLAEYAPRLGHRLATSRRRPWREGQDRR